MLQIPSDDKDSQCHERAKRRGQRTFTLVEQDKSTPRAICFWILENIETAPAEKLTDALQSALAIRKYPNRKNAD